MGENSLNWQEIVRISLLSRELDLYEAKKLYPQQVPYQFSASGHEVTQVILGQLLTNPRDGVGTYYRCRPLLLSLGLSPQQALAAGLAKASSYSGGRDIGVVANLDATRDSGRSAARVLPVAGDVGSQYTPACGWAEAIRYYSEVLNQSEQEAEPQTATRRDTEPSHDPAWQQAIAVAHGGDGSVASNGFWAALNIATTRNLPILFFIEDNGFAISVPADRQTPGGNIARNLGSYGELRIFDTDASDPFQSGECIAEAVRSLRSDRRPVLLRVKVCRLAGHSGQDSQAYKSEAVVAQEQARDPLQALKNALTISDARWEEMCRLARQEIETAYLAARQEAEPSVASLHDFLFATKTPAEDKTLSLETSLQGQRINMVDAVRLTLASEMRRNPKILLLGEDIGAKGGVHTATMGLREEFGARRVIDTSLSEEGIVGSSVGLALSGLRPVPEIQFRKYADAATEQLVNCGTVRWRTNGRCQAPLVVRMPIGVARRVGDPWHSVSGEAIFAHQVGWRIAMPSTAQDAVGLLRTALRSEDPVLFLEHRGLLDAESARGVYPGDDYQLPFGSARILCQGSQATVVSWGLMVERCHAAITELAASVTLIDLRTIQPWDEQTVFDSLRATGRLLLVHEDVKTLGFGAEIAARVSEELLYYLDAPVRRVAVGDIPVPYNPVLTEVAVPSVMRIKDELELLLDY